MQISFAGVRITQPLCTPQSYKASVAYELLIEFDPSQVHCTNSLVSNQSYAYLWGHFNVISSLASESFKIKYYWAVGSILARRFILAALCQILAVPSFIYLYFLNQDGNISSLDGNLMKLVDQFIQKIPFFKLTLTDLKSVFSFSKICCHIQG